MKQKLLISTGMMSKQLITYIKIYLDRFNITRRKIRHSFQISIVVLSIQKKYLLETSNIKDLIRPKFYCPKTFQVIFIMYKESIQAAIKPVGRWRWFH